MVANAWKFVYVAVCLYGIRVQADYSFSKACKDDIELHHCAESNINYGFGRMAKIILCLDEASMDKSLICYISLYCFV